MRKCTRLSGLFLVFYLIMTATQVMAMNPTYFTMREMTRTWQSTVTSLRTQYNESEWRRITPSNYHDNKGHLDQYYETRKKVFVDGRKWPLTITDGKEIDQFDGPATSYNLLVHKDSGAILGGIRLIPSQQPNLTFDHFAKELGLDASVKRSPALFETSRFCMMPNAILKEPVAQRICEIYKYELLLSILEFGLQRDQPHLITVTEPAIERILKTAEWPMERLTDVIEIGGCKTFIARLPVNQELHSKMQEKINKLKEFSVTE